MKKSFLHTIICTNVLQNIPGKFLIQLPRDECHANSCQSNDAGNRDEKCLDFRPEDGGSNSLLESIVPSQNANGHLDLVNLKGSINKKSQVGDADANDLNSVFRAQGIPNNDELVQETKDDEG